MSEPDEVWRVVPGHPSYEVSSLGRLRRLASVRRRAHPKTGEVQDFNYAPKVLTPVKTQYGYRQVNIDGQIIFLHRVVLEAFVGPCPEGFQACHGNGVRDDNRLSNLRWDTPESNREDRERHDRMPYGATHPTAKFSAEAVTAVRSGSVTAAQAKTLYGMSVSQFYRIKRGEGRKRG